MTARVSYFLRGASINGRTNPSWQFRSTSTDVSRVKSVWRKHYSSEQPPKKPSVERWVQRFEKEWGGTIREAEAMLNNQTEQIERAQQLADAGQLKEAADLAESVADGANNTMAMPAVRLAADFFKRLGDKAKAKKFQAELKAYEQSKLEKRLRKIRIVEKRGKSEEALALYRQIADEHPDCVEASRKASKLLENLATEYRLQAETEEVRREVLLSLKIEDDSWPEQIELLERARVHDIAAQ